MMVSLQRASIAYRKGLIQPCRDRQGKVFRKQTFSPVKRSHAFALCAKGLRKELCDAGFSEHREEGKQPKKASRGQAYSTMKILIGAAFAMAMLMLVYTQTSHMNPPEVGYETVKELLRQANASQNLCISRQNVYFTSGEDFSALIPGCIKVPVKLPASPCEITAPITTAASARCDKTACTLWIGYANCTTS